MRPHLAALLVAVALPVFGADDLARVPLSGFSVPPVTVVPVRIQASWEAAALRAPEPGMARKSSRGCEDSGLELCLGSDGRLTVPGARKLLPAIPGLTPERLSVKRSGVLLGYSF